MSDRLTDEQVERMAAAPAVVWGQAAAEMLAREVQEYRALRPDCPTCEGSGKVAESFGPMTRGFRINPCPDCTDGKMPLDKWVALLVETLVTAADRFAARQQPNSAADILAVLKMAEAAR